MALHHPARELLYRDFCELIVRLSSQRYPQLLSLEQQLQQVLSQHLVPLVASSATAARRASTTSSATCVSAAAAGPPGGGMGGTGSPEALEEEVVQYLGQEVDRLQQLFELVAMPSTEREDMRNQQQQQQQGVQRECGGEICAGIGAGEVCSLEGCANTENTVAADSAPVDMGKGLLAAASVTGNGNISCMASSITPLEAAAEEGEGIPSWEAAAYRRCCSTRNILGVWQQAQVLWEPLSSSSVGHAFLDGILAADDPQEPR